MATGQKEVGWNLVTVGNLELENRKYLANCKTYLSFEPTDCPAWRSRLTQDEYKAIPPTSKMISDILSYRNKYLIGLSNTKIGRQEKDKADREILIKFLLNVQEKEKIEKRDAGQMKDVINSIDASKDVSGIKRRALRDSGSNQDSIDSEDKAKKRNTDVVPINDKKFVLPCYPSDGNIEDEISSAYKLSNPTSKPANNEREARNLYEGYKHIAQNMLETSKEVKDISEYLGFIEVDTFILKTHKILMAEIKGDHQTEPGKFSTNVRCTDFDGRLEYPHFKTDDSVRAAVQMIVDKYNAMIGEIGEIPDSDGNKEEKLKLSFKCASLFLFGFLALHPFGDGNGRLARLLCSYSLLTFSPFLTPIYNVFSFTVKDDYVKALIVAREDINISKTIDTVDEARKLTDDVLKQKPSDLCALIIESNWSMWRKYINILGIH